MKCHYKIKVIGCEPGQMLYHESTGTLTVNGSIGTLQIGTDKNMGQPWKGTWNVGTKDPINLKTVTGAEVIFKMSDFFNTAPKHDFNINETMN